MLSFFPETRRAPSLRIRGWQARPLDAGNWGSVGHQMGDFPENWNPLYRGPESSSFRRKAGIEVVDVMTKLYVLICMNRT